MTDYPAFRKVPRLNRSMVVTEKADGTNGQAWVYDPSKARDEGLSTSRDIELDAKVWHDGRLLAIRAGSRNRWINIRSDNFGFARWVHDNAEALVADLGEGRHYGEWWGHGIQRGYGMKSGERYFSLFNVSKFEGMYTDYGLRSVPILWKGNFKHFNQEQCLQVLANMGSFMAPGYMSPEGLMVFHEVSGQLFKVTLVDDEIAKGAASPQGGKP